MRTPLSRRQRRTARSGSPQSAAPRSSRWAFGSPARRQVDESALVAHVLRRLTFGPQPGQLSDFVGLGSAGTIEQLLAAAPLEPEQPKLETDDEFGNMIRWGVERLIDPAAGVHEKMVWFWHGHLTSSLDKADPTMMLRQHNLLRANALGNFRTLLQAMAIDGAMLEWLDGAWSTADSPNENFARELMELFALGRGNYTEADVRAAAYAFAGWGIDYEDDFQVYLNGDIGPTETRTLFGVEVANAEQAVNAVVDHPACAGFISSRMYEFFVGQAPDDALREELAGIFRSSGMEIRPLLEAIVRHPSFLEIRLNRHRPPVEWFAHTRNFLGVDIDHWILESLGQMPFQPPNVRGWPNGERWHSAGATFAKAQVGWDHSFDTEVADSADPVGELLWKAGLVEVSVETRAVLDAAVASVEGRRERATLLHSLIVCSPEFSVS
jgi:uncharacterized protein (DUF1800 family)